MKLMLEEGKKLWRLPALWCFFLLCLAFNAMLIFTNTYEKELFNSAERTKASASDNLFETYDTGQLSRFYQEQFKESPTVVRLMQRKYQKTAVRVQQLSQTKAALDFYAGPITHDSHQFLFGTLIKAVTAEGALLAMLSMLYLLGQEALTHTEGLLCASRRGRSLWKNKIAAGLLSGTLLYALLSFLTLLPYFLLWDYSSVWNQSVSSRFNYIQDLLITKPFITWADFTVAQYLAATLLLGAFLILLFSLLAAICGLCIRNTYLLVLFLLLFFAGGLSLSTLFADQKLWVPYLLSYLQPICLWLSQNVWFTESGSVAAFAWQEVLGTAGNLILFGLGSALALKYFYRKDLI